MGNKKCQNKAAYRYTWAGRDEAICCEKHAIGIKRIGEAMGYYIQLIPLSEKDLEVGLECTSFDKSNEDN